MSLHPPFLSLLEWGRKIKDGKGERGKRGNLLNHIFKGLKWVSGESGLNVSESWKGDIRGTGGLKTERGTNTD